MPITGPDGKPYKASGTLQQYDPQNSQHALYNFWDAQLIRQFGSPIYYYETFIPSGTIDKVYAEARGKLFSEHPTELWATYDPEASQNYMNQYGIDGLNDIVLECNAQEVIKLIGHQPAIGSRIYTPHLGENWRIVQRNLGEFKQWGALRLYIICSRFQESSTTANGRVTANNPNIPKAI